MNEKLYIVGDIHGEFGKLNELLNKYRPDIVIACGDFGFWPGHADFSLDKIKAHGTKIYFCDGNHENHDELDKLVGPVSEVANGVFHVKRGTILDMPFLGKTMFMGGATSVDKQYRTVGFDWFPQECISQRDIMNLDWDARVDTVISHTCPTEFDTKSFLPDYDKVNDSCRVALSQILQHYKPGQWFFGHWHDWVSGVFTFGDNRKCFWTLLNDIPNTNWWVNITE